MKDEALTIYLVFDHQYGAIGNAYTDREKAQEEADYKTVHKHGGRAWRVQEVQLFGEPSLASFEI